MRMKTYCTALEFSAKEGMCHIPMQMMNNLCVDEGSEVYLCNIKLKKGTYVKFRPHERAFIELPEIKTV